MKAHAFRLLIPAWLLLTICACKPGNEKASEQERPFLVVLGTLQDGGSPHAGCKKSCCAALFHKPDTSLKVVCLGLVDPESRMSWMFEATPDLPVQMKMLKGYAPFGEKETPDGIFLTHAHIGHYAGLMFLGREAMGTKEVPVYAMPRMKSFIETNGPWDQLVKLKNIRITGMQHDSEIILSANIRVKPLLVPHRDEYSETVGYRISGPHKKVLFIPDIDKWSKWERDILKEIRSVDYAFIDATFYDAAEISNRDIREIPHPFVIESMKLFANLSKADKSKIHFIHFNHSNPLLNDKGKQAQAVKRAGFKLGAFRQKVSL